ncbi:MAG TPA: PDZ domain-containing protein [Tepidisphaeraceae bacterium]|jgi:hypothetical protein
MTVYPSRFSKGSALSRCALLALSLSALGSAVPALAEDNSPPDSRPLLKQFSSEAQSLYQEVQGGVVRVQLPTPKWVREAAAKDNPLRKGSYQLNQQVQTTLREQESKNQSGQYTELQAKVAGTTQPAAGAPGAGAGSGDKPTTQSGWKVTKEGDTIRLESTGEGVLEIRAGGDIDEKGQIRVGQGFDVKVKPGDAFAPNNVGLMIDNQGHILVPIAIEKETIGEKGVPLSVGGAAPVLAKFVGSDRQTNITILKVEQPAGRPLKLAADRLADGSVVMVLSPSDGAGRLAMWTGGQKDYGVVVNMEGAVAGFARYGQFLSAPACKPIITQLIKNGVVKRAPVGISLHEVPAGDPLREQLANLGSKPALRITDVTANSPAAQAGLQEDDLILSLGKQPVGDIPTFAATIATCSGETELSILRNGEIHAAVITLKPQP